MRAIRISQLLFVIITILSCQKLAGQRNVDSVRQRYSKFYSLAHLKVSGDSKWISFSKIYKKNTDTTVVTKTDKEHAEVANFVGVSQSYFLNGNRFLWTGNGTTQLIDLRTKKKKDFMEVSKIETLSSPAYYIILYKNNFLEIYDMKNDLVTSFHDVVQFISNGKELLYIVSKSEETSTIWILGSNKFKKVYTSQHRIKKIELMPSQKYIAVTEQDNKSKKLQLLLLNTSSGQVSIIHSGFITADYIKVGEINNGKDYFLDFDYRLPPASDQQPEIWYGGDEYLWLKKIGNENHQYWFYDIQKEKSEKIDQVLPFMVSIDNERFLLSFDRKDRNGYVSSVSWFDIYLYDRYSKSSRLIFDQVSAIVTGQGGKYILGFSEKKKQWILYDTLLAESLKIEDPALRRPVFSSDNRYVLFESDEGLYSFNLNNRKLERTALSLGQKVSVINPMEDRIYGVLGADFTIRTIDLKQPVILEIRNQNNNETSYAEWYKAKVRTLLQPTCNKVSDIHLNNQKDQLFSIEENFNQPQSIFIYRDNMKKEVYRSNLHDKQIRSARQEILSYKNSLGTPVKGVLYYPLNFSADRTYPLVVSIYEVQSKNASVYPYPYFSEIGINIRSLVDNGYFVFLPDVVLDARGPGYAVLDCVHSGLDALNGNVNIDISRIGLMGHSFGGFGTNFIATHSDRFAAYISGASVSDLVKFYFSFSDLRKLPNYPRFENGQFDIKLPFSENKKLYYDNSPIVDVEKVKKPILLWTGLKDTNVPNDQTVGFYAGLLRNQKKAVALYYRDQDHDLTKNSDESIDLHLRILDWWDYFLKDKKNILWIEKEMKKDAL